MASFRRLKRCATPAPKILAAFAGAFLFLILRLPDWVSWPQYLIALYSVGILHFWYDSFIWKLRRPTVAANFGIPAPA